MRNLSVAFGSTAWNGAEVLAGVTRSPRYETLIALERILKKHTDRIGEALPETSEKRQGDIR